MQPACGKMTKPMHSNEGAPKNVFVSHKDRPKMAGALPIVHVSYILSIHSFYRAKTCTRRRWNCAVLLYFMMSSYSTGTVHYWYFGCRTSVTKHALSTGTCIRHNSKIKRRIRFAPPALLHACCGSCWLFSFFSIRNIVPFAAVVLSLIRYYINTHRHHHL